MFSSVLRLGVIFATSIVLGIMLFPILDNVPMLNDAALTSPPTDPVYFLLVFMSIMALGIMDGWFNQTHEQEPRLNHLTWSAAISIIGAEIGLLWCVWPLHDDDSFIRTTEAGGVVFDFLIFFSMSHMIGHELWAKRHRPVDDRQSPA